MTIDIISESTSLYISNITIGKVEQVFWKTFG